MAKLTSSGLELDSADFYMADSFERNNDIAFCFSPQGTSNTIYANTTNCFADSVEGLCSSTTAVDCAYTSKGVSSLASCLDTKVDCSSFTSSIEKVGNALKQLSARLGISLDSNGNIIDEKRKNYNNAIKTRLRRHDLLTLRAEG